MVDLFSPIHLAIIAVVALIVFGPKRLPELGEGLGKTIRSFKAAMDQSGEGSGESGPPADKAAEKE